MHMWLTDVQKFLFGSNGGLLKQVQVIFCLMTKQFNIYCFVLYTSFSTEVSNIHIQ